MSSNPPQTLSVKRKRNEAPVDALVVEQNGKRLKSANFSWKLVPNPNASVPPALLSPSTTDRRFFLDPAAATRVKHVFVEARPVAGNQNSLANEDTQRAGPLHQTPAGTPRPRKRPGAGSALIKTKELSLGETKPIAEPSEEYVRKFEEFSLSVEQEEAKPVSPTKHIRVTKPKAPALRYKDRHPEQVTAQDYDVMEVDSEYVIDTYVRQDIVPDANGKVPEPQGTVGFLVINEEAEDWWNGEDDSDEELVADDEDENAEDYYTNDYPEDELSSDDEYDRDPYKRTHRHGSDDEGDDFSNDSYGYDSNDDNDDAHMQSDDDDKHFRLTAPQLKKPNPGYWGAKGE